MGSNNHPDGHDDVEILSMGCRLNIAESEAMREELLKQKQGDTASPKMVIVNSCAVTNEAVRQTRQAVRRAKKHNPDAHIIVTGCAAQIDPEMFAAMPEVSRVLGNKEKMQPDNLAHLSKNLSDNDGLTIPPPQKIQVTDIMQVTDTAPQMASAFAAHARAFVEVQNGCDHRCTFCIIPYGRGNSRSVPAGQVIDTVTQLVEKGYKEVVLTGVDVTSYGHDLPGQPHFGHLVERILKFVPQLPRLRLSSLDGIEVDDRLFALITEEKRIMPHVHLSLQSGDNMILKRMKRRHNREQAIALVERLKAKRPDIAIGADLIAGFPTETEEMHRNNVDIVHSCQVVHGHIFPFSPRKGTPAARMPQLQRPLIKARAAELREAVAKESQEWKTGLIGQTVEVLVENQGQSGHADNFAHIAFEYGNENQGNILQAGDIVSAKILGQKPDSDMLLARPIMGQER